MQKQSESESNYFVEILSKDGQNIVKGLPKDCLYKILLVDASLSRVLAAFSRNFTAPVMSVMLYYYVSLPYKYVYMCICEPGDHR